MAQFFINRPVFAWVIAILLMIAGTLAVLNLPIERYPSIAPPSISLRATYPGASADVVDKAVTQVIEQNMTGLDGLIYMSAESDSSGRSQISLTFDNGTNPDTAQVQVQNKLQLAMPLLPQEVQEQGIEVNKASSGFLMVVAFVSSDGSLGASDIADFVSSKLADPLNRVPGVGETRVFGTQHAMRIWLDPNAMDSYGLTPQDIINAIRAQNQQVSFGQLGGAPSVKGQQINATVTSRGRLENAGQFRDIVIRSQREGSVLTLGDVARVELGAETYEFTSNFNRQPATGFAISLATGANALETASAVKAKLEELKPIFPEGLEAVVPYDTTPFITASIEGVIHTLFEAVLLVFAVMFLFLQNLRATLIPTLAIPVVILGTFAVLSILGLSVNMLTMFALVLAIGLLVDDAIVVVENVERVMHEDGLSPREATRKSMRQISGALIGIGVVLSAVFVPMAFLGGSTGIIYRQFSATIVSAMALSVLVALVLTPALCATLLKPGSSRGPRALEQFFSGFNHGFVRLSGRYQNLVQRILRRGGRMLAIFALLLLALGLIFQRLPDSFLPDEDQGVMMLMVTNPVGATQQRTLDTLSQIEDYFLNEETDLIESIFLIQGFSHAGIGQNVGTGFVRLRDWDERDGREQSVSGLAGRANAVLGRMRDTQALAIQPPAVPELGNASGFTLYLKDSASRGHDALIEAREELLAAASDSSLLRGVRHNGQSDTPQLKVHIDVQKAAAQGVSMDDLNSTLSVSWGGSYIDDFVDQGRVKRVYLQADAPYRMQAEDFRLWSVRNSEGQMVPVSSMVDLRWEYGSPRLERYNGEAAMEIQGMPAPGVSSGDAMREIERLAGQLPQGFTIEWTDMSYQEQQAGSQTTLLYILSLLFVFLCLAALYESWSIPSAVLLVAPLGILGTVLATLARGMERDVYFQVAMLTTVGLTSKNAILIVEFARENLENGLSLIDATLGAVRDRLRPILMTSLAFGLGVLPLAIATGAGSGAQRAIGTGVLGGMVIGTLLGLVFTPLFFALVQRLSGRRIALEARAPAAET